jgi:transglutaminase-like putative cysteine protease
MAILRQLVLPMLSVALAFGCAAPRVCADSAPDWLRSLAHEKLPDYPDNPVAVKLLDELQTTVQANGEIDTRCRIAYKILRPEGKDEHGVATVPFDNETKISSFNAWTITADGHEYALKDKDAYELSTSTYEVYSDDKIKAQRLTDASPGNVVGYEYVQKKRPFVFEDNWWFQDPVPLHHGRLILQIPSGWEYSARWINYPEQKPQVSGNQYIWQVDDVPAVDVEAEMPPWEAVGGRVGLKYFPTDPNLRARTTGSWNDLGVWYAGLTQSTHNPSPEITKKVAELTAGITDPLAKMQALTAYAQRAIRYAAIEFGIGGYQPHLAADIFSHQYGDCKDKATLLITMLHEIGVDAYYVVVDADRGIVRPDYPSLRFDHMIVAIKVPDNVDSHLLFAAVDDPKLGRILFFDPTNEYVPLGYLPWYLQHNHGLVVTSQGGSLIAMPLAAPITNRMIRTAKLTLSATGDLSGEINETEWGDLAFDKREMFLESPPGKRAELIEGILGQSLNNYTLTGASLGNLDKYDQSFSMTYKFVSPRYATPSGGMLFLRPRVVGDKNSYMLRLFSEQKPRKYPIQFHEATRQDDAFDITLPPGYVLDSVPPAVQADCAYGSYHSEVTVTDGVLHYKRTYELKDVEVPTEKLPEIKTFLRQIAADQEASALLRRVAPAASPAPAPTPTAPAQQPSASSTPPPAGN